MTSQKRHLPIIAFDPGWNPGTRRWTMIVCRRCGRMQGFAVIDPDDVFVCNGKQIARWRDHSSPSVSDRSR